MNPLTFLHTGDEHIDSDTHGTINPATGLNTAWESNYRALRHLAETAAERGVDAFISAGDLFKTGRPSAEAMLLYVDALAPVAEAGIPIILLDGNHHMTGVSSDHRTVIHTIAPMLKARGAKDVHVASHPQLITLASGLNVYALPWLSKNRVLAELDKTDVSPADGDRLVADHAMSLLTAAAEAHDTTAGPLIFASHVTVDDIRIDAVTNATRRGSEAELSHLFSEPVLPRKELEKLPYAYGALSHIHTPQKVGARLHYAGSPNRLTFTDMPDIKGGNLVTVTGDTSTVERIETPARRMASIDLSDYDTAWESIDKLEPDTLVQILLPVGEPELDREVRGAIVKSGAILAETKARPKPREENTDRATLPEKVDHITALRTWAENHAPDRIDALLVAAEGLGR